MDYHDRDPEDTFDNPQHPRPDELWEALSETKILTERQAEVYVRRDLELEPRQAVADHLGFETVSGLDSVHQTAKKNIRDAAWVIDLLEAYRFPSFPDECFECGSALPGEWSQNDEGEAICLDCAGIDPEEIRESYEYEYQRE